MEGCGSVLKQVSYFLLAGFAIFSATFFFLWFLYGNPLHHEAADFYQESENDDERVQGLDKIQKIMETERKLIRDAMKDYDYRSMNNTNATKLEDLLTEENGRPVRSIILSNYRSGSTFLGNIVASHPGNLYYFEPLADFDFVQVRGPPLTTGAITRILALLYCDYSELNDYLTFAKWRDWYFAKSTYTWERCQANDMCYDPKFLSAMCKLFPFQSMKLVRLRLNNAAELILNTNLNVRILYLVRDPRGTMLSRKHVWFHDRGPEISDPRLLCADLVSDYKTAVLYKSNHPTQLMVVRYEDLATDPYNQTAKIMQFFGRDFHPKVKEYLDSHTTADVGNAFSGQRNSKAVPFRWRTEWEFAEIEKIQNTCALAMKHWGYLPAMNSTHMREFNPLTSYVFE